MLHTRVFVFLSHCLEIALSDSVIVLNVYETFVRKMCIKHSASHKSHVVTVVTNTKKI